MRKINKSVSVPHTLQYAPVPAQANQVDPAYYKADDVRRQLVADQHGKCAYCECDLVKNYNDVDHYRPKSVYYWLGHTWSNLLYACNLCNRTYKKAQFPLMQEEKRVLSPGDVSAEVPLIINPAAEDPSAHILFRRHIMVPLTRQGDETINIFKLNDRNERPELLSNREQLYHLYELEVQKIKTANHLLQSAELSL